MLMGDIARVSDDEVELAIEVIGSGPIERLDIYDGPDLIETVRPYGPGDLGGRVRLSTQALSIAAGRAPRHGTAH